MKFLRFHLNKEDKINYCASIVFIVITVTLITINLACVILLMFFKKKFLINLLIIFMSILFFICFLIVFCLCGDFFTQFNYSRNIDSEEIDKIFIETYYFGIIETFGLSWETTRFKKSEQIFIMKIIYIIYCIIMISTVSFGIFSLILLKKHLFSEKQLV